MASNDPAHPPQAPGALPYPPADQPSGALPYAPTDNAGALPYPTTDNSAGATPSAMPPYPPTGASAMPYPPGPPGTGAAANTNSPSHQTESKDAESKGYTGTDAPPPYSPPVGGAPYPTPTGAPGQMPPPQPGYAQYPGQPMSYPPPGTVTVTRTVQSTGPQVIVAGNCPQCRVGVLSENFTLLGICCAFWFFPLGIICCLSMREKRCTSCGASFA